MKRLIVMGAAIEQVPGIKKAKEMGYEVAVIDYNPKAVGIPLADKFFNVSTIDPEGVLKVAREFGADGFLTLATDLPMRAVAYASEMMGISGVSQHTALLATDKGEMMKAFKENGVEGPWYYIVNSFEELQEIGKKISYPCIMKPTDNAASRGVVLAHNFSELLSNYSYSKKRSHSGQIIIEEYMVGSEVSVEVLSYQGIPHVLQITDKITSGAPHFVEVGHNQPSQLNEETKIKIRHLACRAVQALGIEMGPAHVEIISTPNGPKIVELGARLGGDCITSHLVMLSTGIDMLKETITTLCGGKPDLTPKYMKGAAIRFLTSQCIGIFDHVEGEEKVCLLEGVVEVSNIMLPGEQIESVKSSDDRIAYVICQAETADKAGELASDARNMLSVVMRDL